MNYDEALKATESELAAKRVAVIEKCPKCQFPFRTISQSLARQHINGCRGPKPEGWTRP